MMMSLGKWSSLDMNLLCINRVKHMVDISLFVSEFITGQIYNDINSI